jgi:hypothetical protein
MNTRLNIPPYSVPVRYRPQVCIIGGGVAGLSAAVGAARCGLSVVLIEKYGFCGGATVAGLSGTICGLFSSGSRIEQIVFGFADEFYQRLRSRGGAGDPVRFGKTALVPHDSLSWKETADDLIGNENITVLYHCNFLQAFTNEEGKITSLLLKDTSTQFAVVPEVVVDASGDAEVVAGIQGPTVLGNGGLVQNPTMVFKMANVNDSIFMKLDPGFINQKVEEAHASGRYILPRHHVYIFPLPHTGEVLCNMTRISYPDGSVPVGLTTEALSFAEVEGRKQAREYARFLQNEVQGFEKAYLSDTGVQIGIRQTRSITGIVQLKNDDVLSGKKVKNPVSHSAWPIEAHQTDGLSIVYLEDDHYDIPFGTLIPKGAINLLVAGRCLSAEHEALASARVTAQCFGMGYGAGAACGLMVREQIPANRLTGGLVADWMHQHRLKTSIET